MYHVLKPFVIKVCLNYKFLNPKQNGKKEKSCEKICKEKRRQKEKVS